MARKAARLRRTTTMVLPHQPNKALTVKFPAENGDRIGANATAKIEQLAANGTVLRTWQALTKLKSEKSKLDPNSNIYYSDFLTTDAITFAEPTVGRKSRRRFAPGDLILVTVTITVPATGAEDEKVEVFDADAFGINVP